MRFSFTKPLESSYIVESSSSLLVRFFFHFHRFELVLSDNNDVLNPNSFRRQTCRPEELCSNEQVRILTIEKVKNLPLSWRFSGQLLAYWRRCRIFVGPEGLRG
jgi:hypothetical protein